MMDNLLGKKIGMTQIFDESGNMVPVTVIEAGPCVVTQLKTKETDGYNAIQVGFGQNKKLNKPMKGHLKESQARYLREFRNENIGGIQVGQEIKVEIFSPGDVLVVSGVTIGKGFAGNIKRHHHARGPMSHGSKSHRITGSIGAGTTPGRVFKGLSMPGRMGAVRASVKSIKVVRVDAEKNLLLVKGTVPGKKGNLVSIKRTQVAKLVAFDKQTEKKAEKKADKKAEAKA